MNREPMQTRDAASIALWARHESTAQLKLVLTHPDFEGDEAVKSAARKELERRGEEQR